MTFIVLRYVARRSSVACYVTE